MAVSRPSSAGSQASYGRPFDAVFAGDMTDGGLTEFVDDQDCSANAFFQD